MTTDDRQNQSLHPRGLSLNQLKSAIMLYNRPFAKAYCHAKEKKINNANDSSVKL